MVILYLTYFKHNNTYIKLILQRPFKSINDITK